MRFLNLEMTSPNIDDVKIEFSEGVNVISISDEKLFNLFKYFPIAGLYGSQQKELSQDAKEISSTINILSSTLGREMSFVNNNGEVVIKEPEHPDDKIFKKENNQYNNQYEEDFKNIYTIENFIISSYYSTDLEFNNIDPVFEKDKIKELLIKSEIGRLKFPYFMRREKLLSSKERELVDLEKEKQLLELKKIKKEKILKEIQASEKDISKLEKRRDSILNYKKTLNEIIEQINKKDNISSKINNLKKDIIELKYIKEKIASAEDIISERFSHFSKKNGEQLPDLELIQQSFNSFRDINEQIDNLSIRKKRYAAWAIKIMSSLAIFSLIALMFLLFTLSASPAYLILTFISSISAGAAVLAALVYYFKAKRLNPAELLDEKDKLENTLIDIFKKNDFPVDDYKTAELYEILFQYFDDFITFRDINNELTSLRKKKSNTTDLTGKEKELEQFISEMKELDKVIVKTINSLDMSINPLPAQEDITRTVHDIDELLEENKTEINKKSSLIEKFQEEIDAYIRDEKDLLSSDMILEEAVKHINNLTEEIKHIKFLDGIFNEAIEKWSKDKLEKLSYTVIEKIIKITDNSYTKEKLSDIIKNILMNYGEPKEEYMELKPYISFAIKSALSEQLNLTPLPPVFLIDPFIPDNEFSMNMKKLLPEFFPNRQVVVIINNIDQNINGNLITL
ncbi:MAG: hypothetical protein FWF73_06735 [Spirochaetes bacterium]|nr:hypothetical protein [Spirochaetota bacterium]